MKEMAFQELALPRIKENFGVKEIVNKFLKK